MQKGYRHGRSSARKRVWNLLVRFGATALGAHAAVLLTAVLLLLAVGKPLARGLRPRLAPGRPLATARAYSLLASRAWAARCGAFTSVGRDSHTILPPRSVTNPPHFFYGVGGASRARRRRRRRTRLPGDVLPNQEVPLLAESDRSECERELVLCG